MSSDESSEYKLLNAFILCFLFGTIGSHMFYVDRNISGIIRLAITIGFFVAAPMREIFAFVMGIIMGIIVVYDLVKILSGKFTDSEGRILNQWT